MTNNNFYLSGVGARPDFRLLVTFVCGGIDGVETDGDADNPASRDWTWLIARMRSKPHEEFEVDKTSDELGSFVVSGSSTEIAARAAYFLTREVGASVRIDNPSGAVIGLEELERMAGSSAVKRGIAICAASIWRNSTLSNPYPNLGSGTHK